MTLIKDTIINKPIWVEKLTDNTKLNKLPIHNLDTRPTNTLLANTCTQPKVKPTGTITLHNTITDIKPHVKRTPLKHLKLHNQLRCPRKKNSSEPLERLLTMTSLLLNLQIKLEKDLTSHQTALEDQNTEEFPEMGTNGRFWSWLIKKRDTLALSPMKKKPQESMTRPLSRTMACAPIPISTTPRDKSSISWTNQPLLRIQCQVWSERRALKTNGNGLPLIQAHHFTNTAWIITVRPHPIH